jgi:hypothetical protein
LVFPDLSTRWTEITDSDRLARLRRELVTVEYARSTAWRRVAASAERVLTWSTVAAVTDRAVNPQAARAMTWLSARLKAHEPRGPLPSVSASGFWPHPPAGVAATNLPSDRTAAVTDMSADRRRRFTCRCPHRGIPITGQHVDRVRPAQHGEVSRMLNLDLRAAMF